MAPTGSVAGAASLPLSSEQVTNPVMPESFTFDEARFIAADTPEKKELVLFQWLSFLQRDLSLVSSDVLKTSQTQLEKLLLRHLVSMLPKPSRTIRRLVARCLILIYSKGDTRTLFDTLSALQGMVANKKVEDMSLRIAAVYAIGALTEAHGSKVLSLCAETAIILVKLIKNAKEVDIPLKYETTVALTRCLRGTGKSVNEQQLKDIVKIAKAGGADKLPLIRSASLELYQTLYECTSMPLPTRADDYDQILAVAQKSLDSRDNLARRSAADFVATILCRSQKPVQAEKRKGQKAATQDSAQPERNYLTVDEMLALLTSLHVKASSVEAKVGTINAYAGTLRRLGLSFMQANYTIIARSMISLAAHPKLTSTQPEVLFMRECSEFLLRDTIGKNLSEAAQLRALDALAQGWLSRWPAVLSTDSAPSDAALVCVLNETAALLVDLGPAAAGQEVAVVKCLANLLTHPSPSVNLALGWCLRCLSSALPSHLPNFINRLMGLIQKELAVIQADRPEVLQRFTGYGNILAALISAAPARPLFVSYATMARIFGLAVQLLKTSSSSKDFKAMAAQSRVAWTLIGALMCLGSDFVKVHTPQLLLIWKNVFAKVSTKDTNRSFAEWEYALTSKEDALAALHSYLVFNPKESQSSDIAKRIAVCLNNMLSFMLALPAQYPGAQPSGPMAFFDSKMPQLENQLRKRLLLCFHAMDAPAVFEANHSVLLRIAMDVFAPDLEKILDKGGPPVSSGTEKLGASTSQNLFLTSLVRGHTVAVASLSAAEDRGIAHVFDRDSDVQTLDRLLGDPVLGSTENDPHCLYLEEAADRRVESLLTGAVITVSRPKPAPTSVALVDAAIELFALLLPLQSAASQDACLERLIAAAKHSGLRIPPGRKRATYVNSVAAVIGALKYAMVKKGSLGNGRAAVIIRDLVEESLICSDEVYRVLASETLGRLARVVGTVSFVNPLMQNLIDQVVKNRDPDARAGSALALGYILSYVGGIAGASQLKTIVGILHSLSSDPHPLVHCWALHALGLAIESAGLMYGPYVNSSLSVALKLYTTDSHELSAPDANTANGNGNVDVYPAIGRILYALVGVLGPELQMLSKVRELCFSLYEELKNEEDEAVVVQAIRCIQHFILFAPKHVDISRLIPFLQLQLVGPGEGKAQMYLTRKAAVTCLYQLAQRNPDLVLDAALNNQLEEQLFALLDVETDSVIRAEIRDCLQSLLKHVACEKPSRWLDLCKTLLSKAGAHVAASAAAPLPKNELEDDEGFIQETDDAVAPSDTAHAAVPNAAQVLLLLVPKWRTQAFAMVCFRLVLKTVAETKIPEHFDLRLARRSAMNFSKKPDYLVFRLSDMIRIAFSAATATVDDLRLEGLKVLEDILQRYAHAEDPDFEEHALLEQYQAQISAALTPAFAADSSPDILSLACHVSAVYIGSGINKDLATLSRVIRLLTGVMERYAQADDGHASSASPPSQHADVLLKLSVLTAWARLQITSAKYSYLREITQPVLPSLMQLWIAAVTEYAKMKVEPELLSGGQGANARFNLDTYGEAIRNVVLPFFESTWFIIMQALTSLCESDRDVLISGIHKAGLDAARPRIVTILLGLCIRTLSHNNSAGSGAAGISGRIFDTDVGKGARVLDICLDSIRHLCHCELLGDRFLEKEILLELTELLNRLITTDGVLQPRIVGLIKAVICNAPPSYFTVSVDDVSVVWTPADSDSHQPKLKNSIVRPILKLLTNMCGEYISALRDIQSTRVLGGQTDVVFCTALESITALASTVELTPEDRMAVVPVALFTLSAVLECNNVAHTIAAKALLSLKAILESADDAGTLVDRQKEERVKTAQLLQAMVSSLLNSAESKLRSIPPSDPPEQQMAATAGVASLKNTLLAIVLIITTCPQLSHDADSQERLLRLFALALQSTNVQITLVTLQCTRSLLSLSTREGQTAASIGAAYVRLLLPLVAGWLATGTSYVISDAGPEGRLLAVEEGMKLLVVLYGTTTSQEKRLALLQVILRTYLCMMVDSGTEAIPEFRSEKARSLHLFACQAILQLASQQQQEFRSAIAILPGAQREALQRELQTIAMVQNAATRIPAGGSLTVSA
ncbi:armadillo-type protein [Gaertneriomyces semiglobifer]|nr:armadillo-type protein [Gaertneriomyces semiglobifer]